MTLRLKNKKKSFNFTFNVLFIGRLEKWKGCSEFLDAALKLLKYDENKFSLLLLEKEP